MVKNVRVLMKQDAAVKPVTYGRLSTRVNICQNDFELRFYRVLNGVFAVADGGKFW
jgi:hypothetical protein